MFLRISTAFILLLVFGLLVWVPALEPVLAISVAILVGLGMREYCAIMRLRSFAPCPGTGMISGILIVLVALSHEFVFTAAAASLLVLFYIQWIPQGVDDAYVGQVITALGIIYVGFFAAHLLLLHGIDEIGRGLVTLLIISVGITDGAAYLVGSRIGRHKLAPRISPNKTWEGSTAGLIAAVLSTVVFHQLSQRFDVFPQWTLAHYVGVGIILSLVGQVGDLFESYLKRSAGVKDSGAVFPGHGGVLDRCDSYLFAAPVLYYMVLLLPND